MKTANPDTTPDVTATTTTTAANVPSDTGPGSNW
jgi:hypothetical protein